jgi:tetratricopeptide (TPR) repeat protein
LRALISGQAGVAVMLDGDRAFSIDVECPQPVVRDPDEWPLLLEGADDAYELTEVSEVQVAAELDLAWRKDRSLHLALIFLNGDTEHDARKESAEILENQVTDEIVLRHILNRLHVAPIPKTADLNGAISIAQKRHPRVAAILREISNGQEAIARSRQAWELLPPDLFGSALAKESFGFKAVDHGLFAAMSSDREIDLTGYSREDLEVIKRWQRHIKSLESSLEARRLNAQGTDDSAIDSGHGAKKTLTHRMIAVGMAACILLGVALAAILINTRPVEASSIVRLGTSDAGFQVVQAPLAGLQRELYGPTLIPYPLRAPSKKTAERLFVSGEVNTRAGQLENAATAFRESNASFPTVAARLNEAVALLNSSKLAQAEGLLRATLPDAERSGNALLKAAMLTNLGHIYRIQGRFDDAEQAYSRALEIDREGKYRAGEAADLNNQALVLTARGKVVKGLAGFREALSVAEGAAADSVAADSHLNIGGILSEFERSSEAEQNFQSAAAYYQKQESPLGQANYNFAYGQYMYQLAAATAFYRGVLPPKEIDQGLRYSSNALALYTSASNKSGQAGALMGIGAGLPDGSHEALDKYRQAMKLTIEIGDVPGQAAAFREIGVWHFGVKSYDLAIRNLQRALDTARKIGAYGEECVDLESLAFIMTYTGESDLALKYINEAVDTSLLSGDAFVQASAYDGLGYLLYKLFGKNAEALTALERAYGLFSEVDSPKREGTRMLMEYVRNQAPTGELNRERPIVPRVPR